MKNIISALLVLLPLLANADSQPATYTVQGKHNVLHLVGTVHLLQDSETLPASITRSYADAKRLLLEIDTSSMDPMEVQVTVMSLGMLPEDESLESRLDAATYNKLKTAAETAGLDMMIVDRLRPWLAAMQLEETMLVKIGLDPKSGVEMQLTKRAAQDHKPISGFETMDEQLNFFASLDEKTEMDFLTSTLDELKDIRKEMGDLMNAWRQGDEATLMALMQREMRGHEKFYNVLLTQRNKRWINKLQSLLNDSNENYLVAVGALHLVGNDGVVSLLRRAGYKVTRD